MSDPVRFTATLAGTNSSARWLSVSSGGDAKVVLETSAAELGSVLKLAVLGGKSLRVTVEEE